MFSVLPARNRTPFRPGETGVPPSMTRPRKLMMSVAAALMMTPLVPDARMPASPEESWVRLIDLVMVTEPKPPGSSTLISPPAAVLEMAPANVLQGAVGLHGLASSPTPETQVRVACALAGADARRKTVAAAIPNGTTMFFKFMIGLPRVKAQ